MSEAIRSVSGVILEVGRYDVAVDLGMWGQHAVWKQDMPAAFAEFAREGRLFTAAMQLGDRPEVVHWKPDLVLS